jgi:hypothetical protein
VLDDPWPDEPDENDPERRWGSPELDLPKVPEAPKPKLSEDDADPEVKKTFWVSVIFANVALFGLTVGPMVLVFRGDLTLGGVLLAAGAFSGFRLWRTYVSFRDRDDDTPASADAADDVSEASTDEGDADRATDEDGDDETDTADEDGAATDADVHDDETRR